MPSTVLLAGAPLHDLPVFWKNQSGAARMERLTVQMFTFECSTVASEECTPQGGMNFRESTLFSPFFCRFTSEQSGRERPDFTQAWPHPQVGFIYAQRCLSNVTDAGNSAVHTAQYRWIWIVSRGYVPHPPALIDHTWVTEKARRLLNRLGDHRSLWLEHIRPFQRFHVDRKWDVLASPLFLNSHK